MSRQLILSREHLAGGIGQIAEPHSPVLAMISHHTGSKDQPLRSKPATMAREVAHDVQRMEQGRLTAIHARPRPRVGCRAQRGRAGSAGIDPLHLQCPPALMPLFEPMLSTSPRWQSFTKPTSARRCNAFTVLSGLGIAAIAAAAGVAMAVEPGGSTQHAQLTSVAGELRSGWLSDPTSRSIPFPSLRLVSDPAALQAACEQATWAASLPMPVRYCANSSEILINRSWLKNDPGAGAWPLRYWVALALTQALSDLKDGRAAGPVANLQRNCLAGVILAGSGLTQREQSSAVILPAITAHSVPRNALAGTPGQRGYALLTGLGATALSCSYQDMLALSENKVPDPNVLKAAAELRRSSSSLMAVLNSQCRPRPAASCPRRLSPSAWNP